MSEQAPTAAPERFIRLVKRAMAGKGLTSRQLAEKTDVSPAYLSRLFNKERGVPADDIIKRFENILDIQPRGLLFDAAGRHDAVASKVLKDDSGRLLMRAVAKLDDSQIAKVLKIAQDMAKRNQG